MRVGDLVAYKYDAPYDVAERLALVLYINNEGGTLKVLDSQGQVDWFVTSYCEVASESR